MPQPTKRIPTYQAIVAAFEAGNQQRLDHLLLRSTQRDRDRAFSLAIEVDAGLLLCLLVQHSDLSSVDEYVGRLISLDRMDLMRCVLPALDLKARDSFFLRLATARGHFESIKIFLPGSDVQCGQGWPLCKTAEMGSAKMVNLFLDHTTSFEYIKDAVASAACGGHDTILRTLLNVTKLSDADLVVTLMNALQQHHEPVIDLLFEHISEECRTDLLKAHAASLKGTRVEYLQQAHEDKKAMEQEVLGGHIRRERKL